MSTHWGSTRSRFGTAFLAVQLALLLVASSSPAPTAGASGRQALARRISFGAYVDQMVDDPSRLADFENTIRRRTDIASYYRGYGAVFPGPTEWAFADGGTREVLISWDMGPYRYRTWVRGRHDAYLDQVVAAFKAYPYVVHVRPWPEMNGDWQAFQPTRHGSPPRPYGGTYRQFKAAWRYLVTYFRSRDVTNVRWVFNPDAAVYPGTTPVDRIWPGARYVDVLGLDGFNWGAGTPGGAWRPFGGIFRAQYRNLTALNGSLPVWICETGSKEPRVDDGSPVDPDHSKARWITTALGTGSFPRIKALIWFEARKERDWRVESSRGALRAMRSALRQG